MQPDAHNKLKALKKVRKAQKDQVQEIGSDLNRTNWLAKNDSEIDKLLDGLDAQSLDELIKGLPEQSATLNSSSSSNLETTLPLTTISEKNMTQLNEPPTSPKKSDSDDLGKSLASAGESVLGIGVLSGLGAWGGFQLDQHFHTVPWIAVTLSMLGLAGGLARMVIQALNSEKPTKSKSKDEV
jgi:F0F1-type ATP synthase assembly protein I